MATPTAAQLRVMKAIDCCAPADGWGEVFSFYEAKIGTPSPLEMRNFDASVKVLKARGWIFDDEEHGIDITEAGRALLPASHCEQVSPKGAGGDS